MDEMINPVKHIVTLRLGSEYTFFVYSIVCFDRPRQKIKGRDSNIRS